MSEKSKRQLDPVDGILLLDKDLGISSNRALQQVRYLYNAKKAGHTGSLDPLASGLLPICFGEATKLSQYLIDSDKRYQTTFRLGQVTSTGDAEGEVTGSSPVEVSKRQVSRALERFAGAIEQVPPMYSALKKDGQPLYKLARKGIEIERKPRKVELYSATVLGFDSLDLELEVHCSKGFYIRSLAIDLGEYLGCGAHVKTLRRTAVGDFLLDNAFTFTDLQEMDDRQRMGALLPTEKGVYNLPRVELSDDASRVFRQGQIVSVEKAEKTGIASVFDSASGFVGIGEVLADGQVKPRRLFNLNREAIDAE